jgi:ribosomal protein S4
MNLRRVSHVRLSGLLLADLWGYVFNLRKNTRLVRRIAGVQKVKQPPKGYLSLSLNRGEEFLRLKTPRKPFAKHMLARRQLRCFYGIRNETRFRKIIRRYLIHRGNMLQIILGHWEMRVDVLLLRVGFVIYIRQALILVKNKAVRVNGNLVLHPGCEANTHQIVSFSKNAALTVHRLKFLRRKRILRRCPSYVYMSYKLMAFLIKRKPYVSEVNYASGVDSGYLTRHY